MEENRNIELGQNSRIIQTLLRASDEFARAHGMTMSAYWVLGTISVAKTPPTQTELAETLYYSKQTINSILKGLEKKGLVRMENPPGNRKNKVIRLTPEGETMTRRYSRPSFQAEQRTLARIDPARWKIHLEVFQEYADIYREEIEKDLSE